MVPIGSYILHCKVILPVGSYILRCKVILPVGSDILLPQSYIAVAVIFALRQIVQYAPCFPLWGMLSRERVNVPDETGKMSQSDKRGASAA